jgi:hypothetical protein
MRHYIPRLTVGLALLMALAPAAWGAARSTTAVDHKFHAHIDAYKHNPYNCGQSTWGDTGAPFGSCGGSSQNGNNGTADGFHHTVSITWCRENVSICKDTVHHPHAVLPHGYTRWMRLCRGVYLGECHNYILGAVHMPNGPFAVLYGEINGHPVRATSHNHSQVEHNGGPLFLYVGYWGSINNGGGVAASHGYVFGFRGWLHW